MKRILLLLSFISFSAFSQSYREWQGSGTNWGDSSNWNNGGIAYSQLEWKGAGNATSTNNINDGGNGFTTWRLYFQGGLSYSISGNPVNFYDFNGQESWVLNDASTTQNINLELRFLDSGTRSSWITTRNSGALNLGSIFVGGNITELRLACDLTSGIISVNGIISGSKPLKIGINESANSKPNTEVVFNAENIYSGLTTVVSGKLRLNKTGGATLPSGNSVVVENGATLRISTPQTLESVTLNGGILTVDNGVSLTVGTINVNANSEFSNSGNILLTNVLNVNSGTLQTNGVLKLISNENGTARVAPVVGSISGEVEVQRYIPQGKRAYRFLSPAVTTSNSILNNWQTSTHITGSVSGSNGFDATQSGNPSLYTYDNSVASGSGWTPISNTNATVLEAGKGYRILIRGNRNVDLAASSESNMNAPITLKAKGVLKTGNVTFDTNSNPAINGTTNAVTNGFSLVGNPYASSVDWNALAKTGLTDTYYSWDPNMGTSSQRGRYVAFSTATGLNNLGNSGSSSVGRYIQSGQAFFVKNTVLGTPGSLTFSESNKASENANVFRAEEIVANQSINISVFDTSEVALGYPIDGTTAVFGNAFDSSFGFGDVEKLYASGEHLAFSRNNVLMAIEALAPVVATDILHLKTMQFSPNKSYTFKIQANNFTSVSGAFLVDHYLNTETPINLNEQNFYAYQTTLDAGSFATDRFTVVFDSTLNANQFNSKTVSVYPNPILDNHFTIAFPSNITGKVNVKLFNMIGQEIYTMSSDAQSTLLIKPNTQLQSGIYILEIENGGKTMQQKLSVK